MKIHPPERTNERIRVVDSGVRINAFVIHPGHPSRASSDAPVVVVVFDISRTRQTKGVPDLIRRLTDDDDDNMTSVYSTFYPPPSPTLS